MRILIVEDEKPAAKRVAQLIRKFRPNYTILEMLDSVEGTVQWLAEESAPDLIFMDVQLADGLSFDIFSETDVRAPIIFTTAYDQYMQQAFKVNSVDYLLKPIDPKEMEAALDKYEKYHISGTPMNHSIGVTQLLATLSQKVYKKRFLVKIGQQLTYLLVADIAYFYSKDGLVFACQQSGKRHNIDYTLDQLTEVLNPSDFFRINRKIVIRLSAIHKIHTYFNSRLQLELTPRTDLETIVSRERVGDFKKWLDK